MAHDTKAPAPSLGISYSNLWEHGQEDSNKPHRFRVRDPIAKRYASRCFSDKEQGERWAKDQRKAFLKGTATASVILWETLGDQYVETLRGNGATKRYIQQVSQLVREVKGAGARKITDEGFPMLFQRWVSKRTKGRQGRQPKATNLVPAHGEEPKEAKPVEPAKALSPAMKKRFWVIAKAICQQAVEGARGIPKNPLGGKVIKLPKAEQNPKAIFQVTELRKMLADEHREDPWWLFTALAAYTGCRATEVRNLTWGNVDFAASIVLLPADHPGNKAKRYRRIPLQPELRAILEGMTKDTPEAFIVAEEVSRQSESNSTGYFKKYARKCGVDPLNRGPHALRHTTAALLVALNMSAFLVMDYLGHSTTEVTLGYASGADQVRHEVAKWDAQNFRIRQPQQQGHGGGEAVGPMLKDPRA